MSSCCRKMFPSEVAAIILAHLLVVVSERNEAKPEQTKISVTAQTDDPEKPGMIKIDVDYPTDPELTATRNRYLSRLQISKTTGEILFFPDGYTSDGRIYHPKDAPHLLHCMCETIRTATT